MIYNMSGRIRYSEADSRGKLTLPGLIDYFQDCATFHGEDLGNGIDDMAAHHCAWIISSWNIKIYDLPGLYEKISCSTALCGVRMLSPVRRHTLFREDGSVAAEGYSEWIIYNMQTGHPERLPKVILDLYGVEEPLSFPNAGRRIRMPKDLAAQQVQQVRRSEIDTNGHVNNSQYIRLAAECLPEDFSVNGLRVEYRNAAVLGDTICPSMLVDENGCWISLGDTEGRTYVNLCFEGERHA